MAVRGGAAGHGKSGAPLTRGCFLLVLLLLMMVMMLDAAQALSTARQTDLALVGDTTVKFRGERSALMHPTATSFSPPIKNNAGRGPPSQHLGGGSISSSLMPPGVASRAPSTRQQSPSLAAPALTPPPHALRPHTWASSDPNSWLSGARSRPPQPTFMGFGMDGVATPRPAQWSHPQESATLEEGAGGWAGMDAPAMQARQVLLSEAAQPRLRLSQGPAGPGPAKNFGRPDTFGLAISEDLSHLDDRPSEHWQTGSVDRFPSRGGDGAGSREAPPTVFDGDFHQTRVWPPDVEKEEELVEDESTRSLFDFNATSEYQREDYITYHDYDQRSPEKSSPTSHDRQPLTFRQVMDIHNLASQADLNALLEQRGITFDELRAFLDSGARKDAVLEFLKPPTPVTTLTTTTSTTTNPVVLSHSPSEHEASIVEEGHPDDITRQATLSDAETGEGGDAEQDSREQNKKNRKKGRRGKGGRRKNKKRKGKKGQREGFPDVVLSPIPPMDNTTPTVVPDPWAPSTLRTLPEATLAPTAATKDILLPTTQPLTPDTTTSPSSVKSSEVSIVSVTLVEAPTDPQRKTPSQITIVEDGTPSRKHNTHNTKYPLKEQIPRKIPHPAKPSSGPKQTLNEFEEVNFVREEQRDDYVFPLRGLLIISGLMGALAVFTLVVLISYAVIKCSKKPVVNNYQVSEQQKPAGT